MRWKGTRLLIATAFGSVVAHMSLLSVNISPIGTSFDQVDEIGPTMSASPVKAQAQQLT